MMTAMVVCSSCRVCYIAANSGVSLDMSLAGVWKDRRNNMKLFFLRTRFLYSRFISIAFPRATVMFLVCLMLVNEERHRD